MTGDLHPHSSGTPSAARGPAHGWTPRRFFELLEQLGRLRVISSCGPSTFEALCRLHSWSIERGFLNAITPEYHWHLAVSRLRHLRSADETHARSGRRVLFFELRESGLSDPFLRIYVHREKGAEFEAERERAFAAAHAELSGGALLVAEERG